MTSTIKVGKTNVMATPTGLKLGSRGTVQPPGEVFGMLTKGEARKLRKQLAANGFTKHASQPRINRTPLRVAA